ncbi:MAG: hypothetical protein ACO1SX_26080 [Actinomycetota bacterium]
MRALHIVAATVAVLFAAVRPVSAAVAEPSAGKPPLVTVVDSPLAEKWLEQAGVPFARRDGQTLGAAPIAGMKLLILPMHSVTTPAAVANIQEYLAGGGKLIAVYWGTLASDGANTNPAYQLTTQLGIRPVGWTDAPGSLSLSSGGGGALPYSGAQITLTGNPAVVVEPAPGSLPVGRWVGPEAASLASGYVGAVYLRGGVIYLASDVLRPSNDRLENREVLFWAMQRVAPDFGAVFQAKERVSTAAHALNGLLSLVDPSSPPEVAAGVSAAQSAMAEARNHLTRGAPARAIVAADRARRLAGDLTERLKRDRERGTQDTPG